MSNKAKNVNLDKATQWLAPVRKLSIGLLQAISSTIEATQDSWGRPKHEIVVHRVEDTRDSLETAKQQFEDALSRFTELTGFDGADLKFTYRRLKAGYELSREQARLISARLQALDEATEALFVEWEAELGEYSNRSLRTSSSRKLKNARQGYARLIKAMRRAEAKIDPVLRAYHDQVLFLKHHLNAQAVTSLHREMMAIGLDIAALVQAMENSIGEANAFLDALAGRKALAAPAG